MKLIQHVFDSKYGNNRSLAEEIKNTLEYRFEVKFDYAKKIKPSEIIITKPYAIIIGGPIRFGLPSLTIKRWIEKLGKTLLKTNYIPEKAIIYCTAFGDVDKGKLIEEHAIKNKIAKEIKWFGPGLKVKELKGPFKEGAIENFLKFIENEF